MNEASITVFAFAFFAAEGCLLAEVVLPFASIVVAGDLVVGAASCKRVLATLICAVAVRAFPVWVILVPGVGVRVLCRASFALFPWAVLTDLEGACVAVARGGVAVIGVLLLICSGLLGRQVGSGGGSATEVDEQLHVRPRSEVDLMVPRSIDTHLPKLVH